MYFIINYSNAAKSLAIWQGIQETNHRGEPHYNSVFPHDDFRKVIRKFTEPITIRGASCL